MKHFYTFLFLLASSLLQAQTIVNAKIIDSLTQKPVPYATISVADTYGVLSNEQGQFTLNLSKNLKPKDSILVQCMGYTSKAFLAKTFKDSIITLSTLTESLKEVLITDKNYTAAEIIKNVKQNLNANYEFDLAKRRCFLRKSYYNTFKKNQANITKSTIPEFNQQFIDSVLTGMPKYVEYYAEILADVYGKLEEESSAQKINLIKASELYDKDSELSFENYEKKFNDIIKKRVKRDSYFKIKTGLVGFKTEVDSLFELQSSEEEKQTQEFIEKERKREADRKKRFSKYMKHEIVNQQQESFTLKGSDFDFIQKSNKYDFKIEDISFLNDDLIYKVSFLPKSKANFKGTLYVNVDDFAIVRLDYSNKQPLKKFSLFGISYRYYLNEGTLIYDKINGEKYSLKYAEVHTGKSYGFDRPIKVIEKNKHTKGRRKQNELRADLHFMMLDEEKTEMIVFESTPLSETIFADFEEKSEVLPVYLKNYDPEFWKGYNIIEPNQAMQEFKSLE